MGLHFPAPRREGPGGGGGNFTMQKGKKRLTIKFPIVFYLKKKNTNQSCKICILKDINLPFF